ncbi:MAG: BON domain-containing protein [Alphaproteobacteria bacterium]|nr:MAG: BON domain-containing protein [Alphaproteobacteria bacterium]
MGEIQKFLTIGCDQAVGGSMSRLTVMLGIVGIVGLPLTLGGCAGALLVGALAGAAGGGYAAAQERGVNGAVSDLQIETNLESAFAAADPALNEGITTTVYQGRVLYVEVAPPRATWDVTKDAWITARIRSELMLDPDIRSGNYTIDTQKGSVYLIGSARSQAELERATRIARYIPDVRRVVTYVELRPGAPVAEQPLPSPARAGSSAPIQSPQGS